MHPLTLLFVTVIPSLACALRCANVEPPAELQQLHYTHAEQETADRLANPNADADKIAASHYVIDTYIHVISRSTNVTDGNVPDSSITAQLAVLNQAYKQSSFSFILRNTTRMVRANWTGIYDQTALEYTVKSSLRQGAYRDLNIYFVFIGDPLGSSGILGYSSFPTMLGGSGSSKAFALDGVGMSNNLSDVGLGVIDPNTVPGGTEAPYNKGITLVHEVGHWFGLYHTFQSPLLTPSAPRNGCSGDGDMIFDTPAEYSAAFGCPIGRDTCLGNISTSALGVDPIHNYMDYSDDDCLTTFSAGQKTRILSMYKILRAGSEPYT